MGEYVNENILKFYNVKEKEFRRLKEHLVNDIGLNVDIAIKLYRTRYVLVVRRNSEKASTVEDQAIYTSNACLKVMFGDVINEAVIDLLEEYDKLDCHLKAVKEVLNDKTAILISDYETIGEDNYSIVGIGHVINGNTAEFFSLSKHYNGKLDKYTDSFWEPDEEKKEKCMKFWRENGMIKE